MRGIVKPLCSTMTSSVSQDGHPRISPTNFATAVLPEPLNPTRYIPRTFPAFACFFIQTLELCLGGKAGAQPDQTNETVLGTQVFEFRNLIFQLFIHAFGQTMEQTHHCALLFFGKRLDRLERYIEDYGKSVISTA